MWGSRNGVITREIKAISNDIPRLGELMAKASARMNQAVNARIRANSQLKRIHAQE
jgi:hypothetical protein